jgi:hypothetical protein
MGTRKCGLVLILAGVLMLAFVLLATPLQIYGEGWGPKHTFGAIVSAAVIVAGIVLSLIPRKPQS